MMAKNEVNGGKKFAAFRHLLEIQRIEPEPHNTQTGVFPND